MDGYYISARRNFFKGVKLEVMSSSKTFWVHGGLFGNLFGDEKSVKYVLELIIGLKPFLKRSKLN